MGEVAAVVQLHPHHGIPRFQQGEVDGHIGLRPAVGLDVGVLCPEEFLGAFYGQAFHHVHVFATAVVAPTRVAFRVLVADNAGTGSQHRLAGVILRCDKDDGLALAAVFSLKRLGNFGVQISQ